MSNPSESIQLFEKLHTKFEQATQQSGELSFHYRIAGYVLHLRFAEPSLIDQITMAFEHLKVPEQVADLTICIIDNSKTATQLQFPSPPPPQDFREGGKITLLRNQKIDVIHNQHNGSVSFINHQSNTAIFWIHNSQWLPWWVKGSPLLRILNVWMMRHKKYLTHVAAVGNKNAGVLLAGRGGAGKSTTAYTCLKNGLGCVSEDYCLLSNESQPYAHSLYSSAKIEPQGTQYFPEVTRLATNKECRQEHEKLFLFQNKLFPKQMLSGFPIAAILILKITNTKDSELKPASVIDALLAITPSTFFQLTHCNQESLSFYKKFLSCMPIYHLMLGNDLKKVASVIKSVVQKYETVPA